MNAVFTRAVRYQVTARCVTPLRTGGGDTEAVLRYENGRAFIQGSSLAGAMREWLENDEAVKKDEALIARLFGSQERGGSLMVSDGVFSADADMLIRPHVKIDGKTGAAEDQKKFDIAHTQRGAVFEFTLTWLGNEEEPVRADSICSIERILSAINSGEILIGAQKSNGFGRLSLEQDTKTLLPTENRSPAVVKTVYDLKNRQDRTAWLEDWSSYPEGQRAFEFPPLSEPLKSSVVFTVQGWVDSILIKSSYTKQKAQADNEKRQADKQEKETKSASTNDVTVNLMEQDCPILPGSSVKGALRSRVSAIARLLKPDKARKTVDALFGRGPEERDGTAKKERASENLDFPYDLPDNGIPGKVRCEDVPLPHETGKRKEIARIRLDRFTGGVIRQRLFWEEPVSGEITLKVSVSADQTVGCALILYALRDLALKLWNLGSGASIGRGFLHVREIEARTPDGKQIFLRDFYQNESNLLSGTWSVEDSDGLWQIWNSALTEWRESHEA